MKSMTKRQSATDNLTLLHLHFASDPESVGSALESTMTVLATLELSDDDQSTSELILTEAINNIVDHAYHESLDGPIELILVRAESHVHCDLTDKGYPMPAGNIPAQKTHDLNCAVANLPEGGFGWNIIRELGKNIKYRRLNGENHLSFDLYFKDLAIGN